MCDQALYIVKVSSLIHHPGLIYRLVMKLCASMDTPSPPVSTRRSSVSSRRKRSCRSKSGVRQTQPNFHTTEVMCMKLYIALQQWHNLLFKLFNFFPSVQMWGWSLWKGKILNCWCLKGETGSLCRHVCSHLLLFAQLIGRTPQVAVCRPVCVWVRSKKQVPLFLYGLFPFQIT